MNILIGGTVGAISDIIGNIYQQRQTPDQEALAGIVQDATNRGRKPLSNSDADQILDWGKEVGTEVRDNRGTDHWVGGDHIHVEGSGIRPIPVDVTKP